MRRLDQNDKCLDSTDDVTAYAVAAAADGESTTKYMS